MKPEQQRISIAEACGWTISPTPWHDGRPRGYPPKVNVKRGGHAMAFLPHYLNDLNACREMENVLEKRTGDYSIYWLTLRNIVDEVEPFTGHWRDLASVGHATAAQRAEAFLRTLNLWRDE